MINKLLIVLCALIWLQVDSVLAFNNVVHLEVQVSTCEQVDSIRLYEFNGFLFSPILSQKIKESKVSYMLEKTEPRIYYIGTKVNNLLPVILGSESKVVVLADCRSFKNAEIQNSILNSDYKSLKTEFKTLNNSSRSLQRQLLRAKGDVAVHERAILGMQRVDALKLELKDSLRRKNDFLGSVAELNTYLSYQIHGEGFDNEVNYFANKYFQFVNWKDHNLAYNPWVFERTKSYSKTMSGINLPNEQHRIAINAILNQIPTDSRTYMLAIGGMLAGMESVKHPNFVIYANDYIERYKNSCPEAVKILSGKIKKLSRLMEGSLAPDFTQNTVEGSLFSLSNLKGKVVLIDFWASWCGPCRKENPNVVRAYNMYKDKGFEVLGVSLDKDKDRWLNAIVNDGLTWTQVSDLKGWQNEVAKLYGVSSIPATFLIDQSGHIISKNLRGKSLEAKLDQIFKK